ncbi:sensor histidine kinase [Helicovermis profundi]|uniref:histidine kinase n=1 Tax=Helicovermis profundi TaxID=3065157 RepID=A0AAU9ES64_9FIRM|nr:hypothetical protein HLPR_02210 [Clostridia bacterium S502]
MKKKLQSNMIYVYILSLIIIIIGAYILNVYFTYEKYDRYVNDIILNDLENSPINLEKYIDGIIGKYFEDEMIQNIRGESFINEVFIKKEFDEHVISERDHYKYIEVFAFDISKYPTEISKVYATTMDFFNKNINKNSIVQSAIRKKNGFVSDENFVFSFSEIGNFEVITMVDKSKLIDSNTYLEKKVINLYKIFSKFYNDKKLILMNLKNGKIIYKSSNAFLQISEVNLKNEKFIDDKGILYRDISLDTSSGKIDGLNNKYKMFFSKNKSYNLLFLRVEKQTNPLDIFSGKVSIYNFIIIMMILLLFFLIISESRKLVDLAEFNSILEKKINERTLELTVINRYQKHSLKEARIAKKELSSKNMELLDSMRSLKETQTKLIESEKMASLGSLVAGVAHEINTPIGNSVTASSFIENETAKIKKKLDSGNIKKSELISYFEEVKNSTNILSSSLNRASDLITSFKKIAVDQSSEILETFNIKNYIKLVITSLNHQIKHTNTKILVFGDEDIIINSFPGAYAQIFSNLIMNSLIHGLEKKENGIIQIKIVKYDVDKLKIIYTDNGTGIDKYLIKKVFDPFFTTKRGNGGSGLGLNVIYNLVTQTLKGEINLISEKNAGVEFTIIVPMNYNSNVKKSKKIEVEK